MFDAAVTLLSIYYKRPRLYRRRLRRIEFQPWCLPATGDHSHTLSAFRHPTVPGVAFQQCFGFSLPVTELHGRQDLLAESLP